MDIRNSFVIREAIEIGIKEEIDSHFSIELFVRNYYYSVNHFFYLISPMKSSHI